MSAESESTPVITAITLPNGQQYQFQYDPTYGLIDKVIYPSGAYIRYSWGLNQLSDVTTASNPSSSGGLLCAFTYSAPAVQHRYVSYDGVNEVLEQDFTYGTTWNTPESWSGKTTTIVTTVRHVQNGRLTSSGSYTTSYNYSPIYQAGQPGDAYAGETEIAVENSVAYGDYSGTILKTISKTWSDPYRIGTETTQFNGSSTAKKVYSYSADKQLASISDYDFGSGAPGQLIRKTVMNYQPFASTPVFPGYPSILDRPCQIITYDSTGSNRVSETDFLYDGGTSACAQNSANVTSAIASLTKHDETNYGPNTTTARGNVTSVLRQNLQKNTSVSTSYAHDETGQIISIIDPNGYTTSYFYTDSYAGGFGSPSAQSDTYLTQITRPTTNGVAHIEKFSYRYDDGQLATSVDENSQTTSYSYNDPFDRPTLTSYPDGGQVTASYNDSGNNPSRTTTELLASNVSLVRTMVMDGAGHVIETQLNSDPSGTVYADTIYDGMGQTYLTSNPYRTTSDSTYGQTAYTYDALGRITQVLQPDGSSVNTSYSGASNPSGSPALSTTVADEAGRVRVSIADGLGRVTGIYEDPNGAANYKTTYTYDPLGDLTGVAQGAQRRTFNYDSLTQLTSGTNPETGTVSYSYDNNGNLLTKTDKRNITTTYSYDALNRSTGKTYNDGKTPSITYTYDPGLPNGIGKLGSVANANSTTTFTSFDPMGRVTASMQATGNRSYGFAYQYNLAGSLTSETYPSGRVLATAYDAANRPTSLQGNFANAVTSYVSQIAYWPHGGLYSFSRGNSVSHAASYNSRLQETESYEAINNSSSQMLFVSCPNWGANTNGGVYDLCPHAALTTDNGNLLSYSEMNGSSSSFTQTFGYDGVNRLTSATDTGGWSQSYSYDAYGNMAVTGSAGLPVVGSRPTSLALYNAQNQRTDAIYDASGNQTNIPNLSGATQSYDAENRVSQTTSPSATTYSYDGNGQRVQKSGTDGRTVYIYDALGKLAAEYSSVTTAQPCTTCYLSTDHLGTTRLVTDQAGNIVSRHDFTPFGEEIGAGTAGRDSHWGPFNDSVAQKFTGKERDAESGLDYFGARYYGSALGRFTSPDYSSDPDPVPYADLYDPQTLNLYAYVRNNPLKLTDPNGHAQVCGDQDTTVDKDTGATTVHANCTEVPDFLFAGVAVGHHFVDQALVRAKGATDSLAGRFFDLWRTGRLSIPGLHRGFKRSA